MRINSPKGTDGSRRLRGLQPHSLLLGLYDAGVSSVASRKIEEARSQVEGDSTGTAEAYLDQVKSKNAGAEGAVVVRYVSKGEDGKLGYLNISLGSRLIASELAHEIEVALMEETGQV